MTVVVSVQVVAFSTGSHFDVSLAHSTEHPCGDSVFAISFGCFSPTQTLLGRTEMRTREMKDRQLIRMSV